MTDLSRFDGHTEGPWDEKWCSGALRHISKNVDDSAFYYQDESDQKLDEWGDVMPPVKPTAYNKADCNLFHKAPALLARVKELEDALGWIRAIATSVNPVYDLKDVEHFTRVLNKEWL